MAYGQFVGYEPHPAIPGAYNFQTANGQALTFGGPEAETLKSRLDAYGAAHMVAGPGGGDDEPAAMAPAAPPSVYDPNKGPVKPPLGDGNPPNALAALPPGEAAALNPKQTLSPVMVNGINTGYVQDQTGRLYEQKTATAGTTQAQLQKRAGQGVATPNSESTTVRGAKPINEEYLAERNKLNEAEHAGMEQEANADVQAYQAGQQAQHQNLAMQTGMMDAQQQQVQAIQQQVAQAQSVRDQALAEYSSSKVDPDRIFSGGEGVLKRIGAALAAGAGAWAATMGHTRNFAQEIIDQAVNRDIAAQEAQIRIKKDAADNALSDLMRRGMSLDQAKNTLATIQNQWMQRNMADAATKSGDERIAGKWQQQVAERDKQNIDYEQAYRDKAAGEATKTIASRVMYPQAGSAGGLVPVAPGKSLGIAGTTAGTEGTVAGTAKTIGEIGKGGTGGKAGTQKAQKLADIDAAEAQLAKFENTWSKGGKKGVYTTGYLGSDLSQELGAQVDAMAPGLGRVAEGNAPNESTMENLRNSILSADPTKIGAAIQAQKDMLRFRRKAIEEGPDNAPEEAPRKE